MPEKHRQYAEWSAERIASWAGRIGPATATLVEHIIASRAHPEQGYRACLGILRLSKVYGEPTLERAAAFANDVGARTYKSIESILKHRRYETDALELPPAKAITHDNLRGRHYYFHQEESQHAIHGND
jgi:hypothetical protein